jgi:glucose-1-phosphate adenylyltransferase
MKMVMAIVLAGGEGRRMGSLCYDRAKPALSVSGTSRVLDFTLSNCIHSGIKDIAVLVDYRRSSLSKYLKEWSSSNSIKNLIILNPSNGSYRGTADAVYQNMDYLRTFNVETFIILAADHIYKMDYGKLLSFHDLIQADATVGTIQVPRDEIHRFGIVFLDAEGRITRFVEKPQFGDSTLASMGIYAFNKHALFERLIEDAAQPDSPHDFGYTVIPRMVNSNRVFAYRFNDYWHDIGTIEAYHTANMELIKRAPSLHLDREWPILSVDSKLPPPSISGNAVIKNSVISPGCVIKGKVENSVLSPGVWIEEEAVISNSVIMAKTFVGYHTMVDNCIVDEEVNIGKLCFIGFDFGDPSWKSDLTVLGKGATVPSYTAIGRGCTILPYVGTDELSERVISSGSIIEPRKDRVKISAVRSPRRTFTTVGLLG